MKKKGYHRPCVFIASPSAQGKQKEADTVDISPPARPLLFAQPKERRKRTPRRSFRNGADAPGTRQRRASRRRSTSLTASDRSDLSRVTLVENDPELAADDGSKSDDSYEIISYYPPKYSLVEHLRGLFRPNLSKKKATMRKEYSRAKTPAGSVNDQDLSTLASPWILPVYVYPNRGDKGSETVPKVGKCTIDTGNLQGDIVSREFVETVLEYPPERFCELTKEEKRGGTGITGDLHVPEGAVYLTWYHENSTRVFRDMRFLISPHSDCDLIIGARSIRKNGILNVPCLMTGRGAGDKSKIRPGLSQDPEYRKFNNETEALKSKLQSKRNDIGPLAKNDTRNKLPGFISDIASLMVDNEFCSKAQQLYDVLHDEDKDKKMSNEDKMVYAKPLWDTLSALKERKGRDLNSPDVKGENELIRAALQERVPASPLEFERLWQKIVSMYPLSTELEAKLNGNLNTFWVYLQEEYQSCAKPY